MNIGGAVRAGTADLLVALAPAKAGLLRRGALLAGQGASLEFVAVLDSFFDASFVLAPGTVFEDMESR